MNASPIDRKTSHARSHQRGITYKIWVCGWIRSHEGARGTVHRVRWTVAGRQKSRTFRAWALAKDFHDQLWAAAVAGQPFDVKSGLPLSMAPQGCTGRRSGRSRRKNAGGGHE